MKKNIKTLLGISLRAGFLATLCCLSPIVLVLLGVSTTSFALALGDVFFKQYWWAFVLIGLMSMAGSLWSYHRKKMMVCSLDEKKKQRKKTLNMSLLAVVFFVLAYIIYELVLQYIWVQLGWSSWEIFFSALGF